MSFASGSVSYQQGWGYDYTRDQETDPSDWVAVGTAIRSPSCAKGVMKNLFIAILRGSHFFLERLDPGS